MYKSFQRLIIRHNYSMSNSNINTFNEIIVPKKIYRDDLSVLKALSTCVKNEKGCTEFSIIDQPITYPNDYIARKKFIWSKVSGKMSARMAFNELKNEFLKVAHDDPPVKTLMPLIDAEDIEREVQENRLSVEKGLGKMIRLMLPSNSWSFYEANKTTTFSKEVIQSLLELLCVTAGESPHVDEDNEDSFYEKSVIEWRIDNSAELLFADIQEKTPESYCTIIRGASKFNNPSRALEHFNIMREQFPESFLDLSSVNSLLRSLKFSSLNDTDIQSLILELLRNMSDFNIKPTAHTFNNAMFAYSKRHPVQFVEILYQEMIAINIEPTLGTYSILLSSAFSRSVLSALSLDILEILESRDINYEEPTSIDDRTLYSTLMANLHNIWRVDLGIRLNDVVDRGDRFHMFVDNYSRKTYFDKFIHLLLQGSNDLGQMLAIISRYVPKYVMLRPILINDLISRIKQSGEIRLLPTVVHLINWNVASAVQDEAFPRILQMFVEANYEADAGLDAVVLECLSRVFHECGRRLVSVFTIVRNIDVVVAIVHKLGDPTFLWQLIDFADSRNIVRASMVSSVMVTCFNEKNFDRIAYLWKCLRNCVHSRLNTTESERAALRSLVELTEREIIPVLTKFNVAVRETQANVDACKIWLDRGHTSEDFDEEEAAAAQSDERAVAWEQ